MNGREGVGKKLRGTGGLAKLAVLLPERWLSGLRRTPGKREYLNSTVGSNPSLSASLDLRIAGTEAAGGWDWKLIGGLAILCI
jgi:hypothetical protein